MSKAVRSLFFVCLLALPLGVGTALGPMTAGPAQAQFSLMSAEDEKRIGAEEHGKILPQFGGVYDDPDVTGYVAEVGGRLAANSDDPRIGYTFTLLNSPVVNAFALPGGYVYVTRGLMALAQDEAEFAGVLGHEIGHVTAHHAAQRYTQSTVLGLGSTLLGAVLGNAQIGQLAQLGSELYLKSYSRDQEYEADVLGVRTLARTGYAPIAQADFLKSLNDYSALENRIAGQAGAERRMDFFATHPRTIDRVERAIAEAGAVSNGDNPPRRREIYLRTINGMIYGDDPAQGFARGQVFSHAGLRFTFTAPPGFRLINNDAAVIAVGPDGARIRFDSERNPRLGTIDPVDYLTRYWGRNLPLGQVERLSVNGLPAATGVARVQTDQGALDLRLVAISFAADRIDRFLFITPPALTRSMSEGFQRTTYSFRRLSDAEARDLKPLRLRVVTVGPGDTVASLAARMPFEPLPEERFRLLNRLAPGEQLRPGQQVKVVGY